MLIGPGISRNEQIDNEGVSERIGKKGRHS